MKTNIIPFPAANCGEIVPFTLPSRIERVKLHLRCLWRRPAHWRFHVAGLLRELIP